MVSGRYDTMTGVLGVLLMTLQLTKFGRWKCVDSIIHPTSRSYETSASSPFDPPALEAQAVKQKIL